uniref:Uncharacterized protein n=1 Tax=Oryza meridionalis TaxID=40149 RepID=A0A0E0C2B8_9ORYZ
MFLHSLLMQNMAKNTTTQQQQQTRSSKEVGGGAAARSRGVSSKKSPWYQRAVEVLLLIWKQPTGAGTGTGTTTKAAAAAGVTGGKAAASGMGARLRKSSSLNVAASFTEVCLCAPISTYNEQALYFQAGDVAPRRSYNLPAGVLGVGVRRRRLGPSPLRRMALAESKSEADDDEEETTTTEAAEPTSRRKPQAVPVAANQVIPTTRKSIIASGRKRSSQVGRPSACKQTTVKIAGLHRRGGR